MSGDFERPIVTVDVVLLTLQEDKLCTALARRDRDPCLGQWTLPGGWVHADTDQDCLAAAQRILATKTGIQSPYLEQLQTFSGRYRDSRGWSVSVVYYALIPFREVQAVVHDRLRWEAVEDLRALPFDHFEILDTAVSRVRSKTLYSSLPVHLMPKAFTLGQLQHVYEILLDSALDKRGFRRRVEELDVVEPIPGEMSKDGAHRPAQLYRIKRRATRLALADKNLGFKK